MVRIKQLEKEKGAGNLENQAYELKQIMFTFRPARDFV